MSNYISATLSADDQQKIMDRFAEIRQILSFGVDLTAKQKMKLPKMNDGRRPFAEKCLVTAQLEPRVVPQFTDLAELHKDLALYDAVSPLAMECAGVAELIDNIRIAAGIDAYVASLSIYNATKNAAKQGVPGLQSMADEMGKLFENKGPVQKKASPAPTTDTNP